MKILIPIITLLIMSCMVSAAMQVTLDPLGTLANGSYQTSSTVTPNFKVTGENSSYTCKLWTNENGSTFTNTWTEKETTITNNNTNTSFSSRVGISDNGMRYYWDVNCSDGYSTFDWGGASTTATAINAFNFSVDTVAPIISVTYPTNGVWIRSHNTSNLADGFTYFNITVIDDNAAKCVLKTNLDDTTNLTNASGWAQKELVSYVNNTWLNFTFGQSNNKWTDNNTGAYQWYVICNDSAKHTSTINYSFNVDTTLPAAFAFNLSLLQTDHRIIGANDSYASDYTPRVGYSIANDTNFAYYRIRFYDTNIDNETYVETNVTTMAQQNVSVNELLGDKSYQILITAFDSASNQINMTLMPYQYNTRSLGRKLSAGWNILGNVGNVFNLSSFLSWTSTATTVAIWNSTNQFVSHVSGGTGGEVPVNSSQPVFIYVSTDTNYTDNIWNLSAIVLKANITNATASNWSILMNSANYTGTSGINFSRIDTYLNNCTSISAGSCLWVKNVTYFSYYNNSATQHYVPYVANFSYNNNRAVPFGECVWMYKDMSVASGYKEVNWGDIQ